MKTLLFPALLTLAAATVTAGEVSITMPTEPLGYKPGQGIELAQANCTLCHSAEYPSMQPPMPKKFWEGTVKKMREKYGAPIPEEAVPELVSYLTQNYGVPEAAK